jgi:glucose-1-phosphate cytidylyltransferase
LVKIGTNPILYHIIKLFKYYGYNRFIICTGYKQKEIKSYFYKNKNNKLFKDLKIEIFYTGLKSNTGLRIKKVKKKIKNIFFLTYCDGLIDLNLKLLLNIFLKKDKIGLMTVTNPQSRFGIVSFDKNKNIFDFNEKKIIKDLWVNAGFYIFKKEIFNFIKGKNPIFESEVLKVIASQKKMFAYHLHSGFWKCMDTIKDKLELDRLWKKNKAPWDFDEKIL